MTKIILIGILLGIWLGIITVIFVGIFTVYVFFGFLDWIFQDPFNWITDVEIYVNQDVKKCRDMGGLAKETIGGKLKECILNYK